MFIIILFTIAKTWKQHNYPPRDDCINISHMYISVCVCVCVCFVCVYTHTGILFDYNTNEMVPFSAKWIDLENVMLSEKSQRRTNTV